MSHSTLRDLAKVGVGIIIADIFSALCLTSAGLFRLSILGVTWSASMVPDILLFDVAVLILLVHLGWKVRMPVSSPTERTLLRVSGTIFLVVALVHFLRITFDWQLALGGFMIPLWRSWFGGLVTLYLSYASFHYVIRKKR